MDELRVRAAERRTRRLAHVQSSSRYRNASSSGRLESGALIFSSRFVFGHESHDLAEQAPYFAVMYDVGNARLRRGNNMRSSDPYSLRFDLDLLDRKGEVTRTEREGSVSKNFMLELMNILGVSDMSL